MKPSHSLDLRTLPSTSLLPLSPDSNRFRMGQLASRALCSEEPILPCDREEGCRSCTRTCESSLLFIFVLIDPLVFLARRSRTQTDFGISPYDYRSFDTLNPSFKSNNPEQQERQVQEVQLNKDGLSNHSNRFSFHDKLDFLLLHQSPLRYLPPCTTLLFLTYQPVPLSLFVNIPLNSREKRVVLGWRGVLSRGMQSNKLYHLIPGRTRSETRGKRCRRNS